MYSVPTSKSVGVRKLLPTNYMIQLDKSTKQTKYRYLLAESRIIIKELEDLHKRYSSEGRDVRSIRFNVRENER